MKKNSRTPTHLPVAVDSLQFDDMQPQDAPVQITQLVDVYERIHEAGLGVREKAESTTLQSQFRDLWDGLEGHLEVGEIYK